MSQKNLELVRALQPAADVDLAPLFRDDELWAGWSGGLVSLIHPDFECVNPGAPGEQTYAGVEGFRAFWLDWLSPWATYRAEVEKPIECGEQVLVLATNFGRLHGSTQEVQVSAASIYVFREGKIARYEGYLHPADALRAAGLEE